MRILVDSRGRWALVNYRLSNKLRSLWGYILAGAHGKVGCLDQGGILVAFQDKTLVCRECANEFTFTEGEQEFYQQRGLVHEPARCQTCRADRRKTQAGSDSGPREMYPAVCASCGKETEVPFQPRQGRPVYCSDCYSSIRSTQ